MTQFPLASNEVADPAAARDLIKLLDTFVPRLEAFGEQPVLITDAPNKFNDAYEDDYWCTVRSGETWWEQSQFFVDVVKPRATEASSFLADPDAANAGAALMSQRIADLRGILLDLNKAGWRRLVEKTFGPRNNLHALIVENGQPWLFLEYVNGHPGDAFGWDADGFFHGGTMDRLDHVVTRSQLLLFEHLDVDGVARLNPRGQRYFLPDIVDPAAATRLANAIHAAIEPIRAVTADAIALIVQGSRSGADYDVAAHRRPAEATGEDVKTDTRLGGLCRTALANLKAADWRAELGRAIGEPLDRGEAVAAVFDGGRSRPHSRQHRLRRQGERAPCQRGAELPRAQRPLEGAGNVRLSGL